MELSAEDIQRRVSNPPPTEFPESQEALKKQVLQAVAPDEEKKAVQKLNDPRSDKIYTFQFDWTDGRGKVWKGAFTNKILTIREQQLVGIARARLAGGVPISALDTLTEEINLIVAHLTFSLTEKPEWANDLTSLENVQLLQAIYEEVASHEAYFFGWSTPKNASKEGA